MYFFPFISFVGKQNCEDDWILDLWVQGGILTITTNVFSFKLLCKKNVYIVNHCAGTVKKCWALYIMKFVKPNATFNLLLSFNVCLMIILLI